MSGTDVSVPVGTSDVSRRIPGIRSSSGGSQSRLPQSGERRVLLSDGVARLRETGVIRRFTLDVDRSQLHEGIPVLVHLDVDPGEGNVASVGETLLSGVEWSPDLDEAEFALSCAECGNTVEGEGVAVSIGGELYQLCCSSYGARFEGAYAELERGAD